MPNWVKAVKEKRVPSGARKVVRVRGRRIVFVNVEGSLYALDNECVHAGGPLNRGYLDGHLLICLWHDWPYDVRTGKLPHNPRVGVRTYPTKAENGRIYIDYTEDEH